MPRIEFYVLPSSTDEGRLRAACQLAAKAWRQGLGVFLRGEHDDQCAELDELLWRFKAECFVPHARLIDDDTAPVLIGSDTPPAGFGSGLLVNLNTRLPTDIDRYSRVIEIVNQSPALLAACRENFRQYRQRGYDPQRVEL
ncbi:DNA polymerase III subunit chi [Stutzerimonas urumqiensis]|uniref:DNA polymerase III subunit chi n=1 Tax=Stutzerimonas urumqiensis TaxID=638269 RepID=UPI003BA9E95E